MAVGPLRQRPGHGGPSSPALAQPRSPLSQGTCSATISWLRGQGSSFHYDGKKMSPDVLDCRPGGGDKQREPGQRGLFEGNLLLPSIVFPLPDDIAQFWKLSLILQTAYNIVAPVLRTCFSVRLGRSDNLWVRNKYWRFHRTSSKNFRGYYQLSCTEYPKMYREAGSTEHRFDVRAELRTTRNGQNLCSHVCLCRNNMVGMGSSAFCQKAGGHNCDGPRQGRPPKGGLTTAQVVNRPLQDMLTRGPSCLYLPQAFSAESCFGLFTCEITLPCPHDDLEGP